MAMRIDARFGLKGGKKGKSASSTSSKKGKGKGKQAAKQAQQAQRSNRSGPASKPLSGPDRQVWLPGLEPPEWLDGSMPGDAGFDPLKLSAPTELVQMELDELDQNKDTNKAGDAVGRLEVVDNTPDGSLQPYTEVFDINRFRECELLHGRWAMLGFLGFIVSEAVTGVNWYDAGYVELQKPTYFGFELPWNFTTLLVVEVLTMGFVEVARNRESDLDKRCYPGGPFDPLKLLDGVDEDTAFRRKVAELKHGRLAMIAVLTAAIKTAITRDGSLLNPILQASGAA